MVINFVIHIDETTLTTLLTGLNISMNVLTIAYGAFVIYEMGKKYWELV